MGARSNIVVQDGEHRVWLYGHWMACGAVAHAAHGLGTDRFDDAQYLAGIIYRDMIEQPTGEGGGWGISAQRYDNQYPILVIDVQARWRTGGDRGAADVWFEDSDGTRTSPVYSREEFLAVAATIPAFRPSWDGDGGHDCAYGHFIPSTGPDRMPEPPSAQIGDV